MPVPRLRHAVRTAHAALAALRIPDGPAPDSPTAKCFSCGHQVTLGDLAAAQCFALQGVDGTPLTGAVCSLCLLVRSDHLARDGRTWEPSDGERQAILDAAHHVSIACGEARLLRDGASVLLAGFTDRGGAHVEHNGTPDVIVHSGDLLGPWRVLSVGPDALRLHHTGTPALPLPDAAEPIRKGRPWCAADYMHTVAGLRQGKTLEEIAQTVGRAPGGVTARLPYLYPEELVNEDGKPLRLEGRVASVREYLRGADDTSWQAVVNQRTMELAKTEAARVPVFPVGDPPAE